MWYFNCPPGTGLAQAVSGSIELDSAGVATSNLADDAVTKVEIAADVAGTGIQQNADGSLEISCVVGWIFVMFRIFNVWFTLVIIIYN